MAAFDPQRAARILDAEYQPRCWCCGQPPAIGPDDTRATLAAVGVRGGIIGESRITKCARGYGCQSPDIVHHGPPHGSHPSNADCAACGVSSQSAQPRTAGWHSEPVTSDDRPTRSRRNRGTQR